MGDDMGDDRRVFLDLMIDDFDEEEKAYLKELLMLKRQGKFPAEARSAAKPAPAPAPTASKAPVSKAARPPALPTTTSSNIGEDSEEAVKASCLPTRRSSGGGRQRKSKSASKAKGTVRYERRVRSGRFWRPTRGPDLTPIPLIDGRKLITGSSDIRIRDWVRGRGKKTVADEGREVFDKAL